MRVTAAVALLTHFAIGNLAAKERLVALSPGKPDRSAPIETRCPTFLWSGASAAAYEIAVFRVAGDDAANKDPVLMKSLPGPAFGWTPDADECFDRSSHYAWSVRALGDPGEWSEPFLFRIAAEPTAAEFRQALEVVRRYLTAQQPAKGAASTQNPAAEAVEARDEPKSAAPPPSVATPFVPDRPAAFVVEGESRSVDSQSEPRLWGLGRPGTGVYGKEGGGICNKDGIFYGLSHHVVDWGSAADACPAGTWVCREDEIDPCDTTRPAASLDGTTVVLCDGTRFFQTPGGHSGWLADGDESGILRGGRRLGEGSMTGATNDPTCYSNAVWCCWFPSLGLS